MKAKKASRSGFVTMEDFGLDWRPKSSRCPHSLIKDASDLFSFSHFGNMVCCFRISDVGAAHTCTSLVEPFSGH